MIRPPKEVVMAIVLGIGVGVVVAYGAWTARRALREAEIVSPAGTSGESANEQLVTTPTPNQQLVISEPEAETLTDQPVVMVIGRAPLGSTVVVVGEEQDVVAEVDEEGVFKAQMELIKGVNEILVTAVETTGGQQEKTVTVVYSEVELE